MSKPYSTPWWVGMMLQQSARSRSEFLARRLVGDPFEPRGRAIDRKALAKWRTCSARRRAA